MKRGTADRQRLPGPAARRGGDGGAGTLRSSAGPCGARRELRSGDWAAFPGRPGERASPSISKAQLDLATADPDAAHDRPSISIDSLDEAGYFTEDLAEIAGRLRVRAARRPRPCCGSSRPSSPPGVGARDLAGMPGASSCASATGSIRPCRRCSPISISSPSATSRPCERLCGVDEEDLADMLAEIRRLEPKPGRAFGAARGRGAGARRLRAGRRRTAAGSSSSTRTPLPRVLVNQTYYAEVAKAAREDEDKTFLSDCLQNANWLTRSLDQRAKTILKVATEIVRQQDGFFRHGVAASAPAEPEDRGRRHRHARIDRLARDLEQGDRHRAAAPSR